MYSSNFAEMSFDEIWAVILHAARCLRADARTMATRERSMRLNAIRIANSYLYLFRNNLKKLQEHLTTYGTFDAMLEDWLGPITMLGEDPRNFIMAVDNGMTRKEWLSKTSLTYLGELKTAQRKAAAERSERKMRTPTPAETLSVEAQLEQYKLRDSEQTETITMLKRQIKELERQNRVMGDEIKSLMRRLDRMRDAACESAEKIWPGRKRRDTPAICVGRKD